MRYIDLNADVGEGAGNDAELLMHVTSASIACGAHAGNRDSMRAVATRAIELGVVIGAHPGHADREHYGRREIAITPGRITRLIADQVATLEAIVNPLGGRICYLKPHGALYHQIARGPELAEAVVRVALDRAEPLALLGTAGSCLDTAATGAGAPFYAEAFADRAYLSSGALAPRDTPGALLDDESEVVRQAIGLAATGSAPTLDGGAIEVRCDSLCVHGDGPRAVEFASGVALTLSLRGIALRPFAGGASKAGG